MKTAYLTAEGALSEAPSALLRFCFKTKMFSFWTSFFSSVTDLKSVHIKHNKTPDYSQQEARLVSLFADSCRFFFLKKTPKPS